MTSADLAVVNCKQLLTCGGKTPKRGGALQDVGLLEEACIASYKGKIIFVGEEKEFKENIQLEEDATCLDGTDLVALPGFVDSHTHLPFAGTREEEFVLRLKGYSYQELAEKGLGIQTTVKATRRASKEELLSLSLNRLDNMLLLGTTTAEAKSGYF